MRLPSRYSLRGAARCILLAAAILAASVGVSAETYTPLFSADLLRSLDAETQLRFAELEAENRRRWLNKNPSNDAASVDAARQAHQETERALQHFEESRYLRRERERDAARQAEHAARRTQGCERLGKEIRQLQAGGPLYESDAKGERRYLSDQEIVARVKSRQKKYKKYCSS